MEQIEAISFGRILLAAAIGYLLGSVNGAQFLHHYVKRFRQIHPYRVGTKNAGMQNVWMMIGRKPAFVVLAIDLFKGYFSAFLGIHVFELSGAQVFIPGIFAIIGHNWPVFFHFQGGRGVATLASIALAYDFERAIVIFIAAIPFIIVRVSGLTPFVIIAGLIFFEPDAAGLLLALAFIMILRRLQGEWEVFRVSPKKLWVLKNIIVYDRATANPPSWKDIFKRHYS
jgi:glycerol-3-phosphate acyltransferase PlsY